MVRIRLIAVALLAVAAVNATPQKPVIKAVFEVPKTVVPGKPFKGTVRITFPSGWHGYSNPPFKDHEIPTEIKTGSTNLRLRKVSYPAGQMMTFNDTPTRVYEGTIRVPVEAVVTGKPGAARVSLKIGFQLCDDKSCIPPDTITVTQPVTLKRS
jgi:DsbC/DsbD-like thiol-disulfide interchange protein